MTVVIAGAGRLGFKIAELLSNEHQDVILIDPDETALEKAAQSLDVGIQYGSGCNWKLLEEIMETSPKLFLALTGHDETNLAACEVAKGLGIPKTIARVSDQNYLNHTRLDFSRIFAVDHFVSPKLLAAGEIYKYVLSLGSARVESYAHGAVQMRTIAVSDKWKKRGKTLAELDLPDGVMVSLIYRQSLDTKSKSAQSELIFPHGDDQFLAGDEVTLVGTAAAMERIHEYFGIPQRKLSSAVILGGGPIGLHVAKALSDKGINVRLIEQDENRCGDLAELLPHATVIHHDAADLLYLQAERIETADVVVAATGRDDTNVMLALLAKEIGCHQVCAVVANTACANVLKKHGISHFVSPVTSAANRIMAIAQADRVIATSSLYNNRAKVMEVKVSVTSKIVGIPLSELAPYFPKDFLFAVIQNRGRIMIANGRRILCPGDTAILTTSPEHSEQVLELF